MAQVGGKQIRLRRALSKLRKMQSTQELKKPSGGNSIGAQSYQGWLNAAAAQASSASASANAAASAFEAAMSATEHPTLD